MKWTNKAFIQRMLSNIPFGKSIYYLGQFHFGRLRHFNIEGKMQQVSRMLKGVDDSDISLEGLTAVEIGTGWAPVIPMFFWLFGQKACNTYDTSNLLSPSLVIETAKQLLEHPFTKTPPIQLNNPAAFEHRGRLLNKLITGRASGHDILESCGINYHAPCDASETTLANESVDIIYSNTVLEHVPASELNGLFAEFRRILRPNGHIFHLIDMSDHFAHSDPTISSINFLQFSEESFASYNTRFLYQNRLRVSDWRQIISDQGFETIYWQTNMNEKSLKQLSSLRLDEAFASLNAEEICTSSVCVLAAKRI